MALDGGIGDQQLSAAVLVNITIVDVNNKPPVLVEPGTITVRENTQVINTTTTQKKTISLSLKLSSVPEP